MNWSDEDYARSMVCFFIVVAILWYFLVLRG